jgi:hypothetical protein
MRGALEASFLLFKGFTRGNLLQRRERPVWRLSTVPDRREDKELIDSLHQDPLGVSKGNTF